ncbi:FGGY-family carbohydrate kinase [Gynuella sunshinyii]|uniref:Sugar (Pentulose and hexulose) kinase n=1 Tax=Gynuella sunshinyii YC6258 TaxID=1445510 RepID=A0A0C5VTD4_9GAMM|nr:FGGY family carbohydrate kinase [Gynuella sunshinyii]AJQ96578.1 sugar (pentulose and hexulose) kinase [Gynuella sunshinyii YC6258]
MKTAVIAVFDIGKTHIKLSAVDLQTGMLLALQRSTNIVRQDGLYPHVDSDAIWAWLKIMLTTLAARFDIRSIAVTTHGATIACVDDTGLVLPIADYEYDGFAQTRSLYRPLRPAFEQSYSPELSAGLNLGAQLFWQQHCFPEQFARVTALLTYPQYWGWRLTGVKASERTSLGCHTDLWAPDKDDFSTLVDQQNWRKLFPPVRAAGESLGTILPELARELGLAEDCIVVNGIHDSNASLVPHLLSRSAPFGVISSGTWTIITAVGASLSGLNEQLDMLANVSVFAQPVPSIRFMGGREWQQLATDQPATQDDLQAVLAQQVYAIPAFSNQGGPFQHHQGYICGPYEQLTAAQKTALATLYVALMSDECLTLQQQRGDLIIEGAFAGNELYLWILATLRPQQAVFFSRDETGTTVGMAMLAYQQNPWRINYQQVAMHQELYSQLQTYRHQWRQRCEGLSDRRVSAN